jgi:hypothetical protein
MENATLPTAKIRRMDAFPFVVMGMVVFGTAGAIAINGVHDGAIEGVAFGAFLLLAVVAYLDGPVAYLAAGPSLVVVGNSFVRYDIPRARAVSVDSRSNDTLKLLLDDGSAIAPRVFAPAMGRPWSGPARHSMARARIQEAMGDKPAPASGDGVVRRRVRWGSVTVLCLPLVSAAAIVVSAHR